VYRESSLLVCYDETRQNHASVLQHSFIIGDFEREAWTELPPDQPLIIMHLQLPQKWQQLVHSNTGSRRQCSA
jgi:hypothetical protein